MSVHSVKKLQVTNELVQINITITTIIKNINRAPLDWDTILAWATTKISRSAGYSYYEPI
jgi:hypothetical protein